MREMSVGAIYLDVIHDNAGDTLQRIDLLLGEFFRFPVDDTQAADRELVPVMKRNTCIEADMWFTRDKGIGDKTRVLHGIRDDHHLICVHNRVGAEGVVSRGLLNIEAVV